MLSADARRRGGQRALVRLTGFDEHGLPRDEDNTGSATRWREGMEFAWANGATNIRNTCKTISSRTILSSTTSWRGGIRLRASNLQNSQTCSET